MKSLNYSQGKARQGKARQGKRQKYSININLNHNGRIITLFKFFVNCLIKKIVVIISYQKIYSYLQKFLSYSLLTLSLLEEIE